MSKITFIFKNDDNQKAVLIYAISELLLLNEKLSTSFHLDTTFFTSLKQPSEDTTFDFSSFFRSSFEFIVDCIHNESFQPLTSYENIPDICKLCEELGLETFLKFISVDNEDLFRYCLTDLDKDIIYSEKVLRHTLFSNEDVDYRNEDEKFLLQTTLLDPRLEPRKDLTVKDRIVIDVYSYRSLSYDNFTSYFVLRGGSFVERRSAYDSFYGKKINFVPLDAKMPIGLLKQNILMVLGDCPLLFDENIVIAGGAVNKCLTSILENGEDAKVNDIDIFFITKNQEEAEKTMYNNIVRIINASQIKLMIRSKNAVTVQYKTEKINIKIQFILRLYNSIAQVISGFDIDGSCAAFDGKEFYVMPRYLRSVNLGYIVVDPERQSTSYRHRLEKYRLRGFDIAFPGYHPSRVVNPNKGIDKLVKSIEYAYYRNHDSDYDHFINIANKDITVDNHIYDIHSQIFRIYNEDKKLTGNFDEDMKIIKETGISIPFMITKSIFKIFTGTMPDTEFTGYCNETDYNPIDESRKTYRKYKKATHVERTCIWMGLDQYIGGPKFLYGIEKYKQRDLKMLSSLGRLTFKTKNPGTQLTNSFHPVYSNWFSDAYVYIEDKSKLPIKEKIVPEEEPVEYSEVKYEFPPKDSLPIFCNYSQDVENSEFNEELALTSIVNPQTIDHYMKFSIGKRLSKYEN